MNHPSPSSPQLARLAAGIPEVHSSLFWRIRFSVGDQVVLIELPHPSGSESVLILRDIEMDRARSGARVDRVACPADYAPEGGLSGDRETANAQAAVECLRRAGVTHALGDRTLPLIFADFARRAGIVIECDPDRWVKERRQKTEEEIAHLRQAQRITEGAVEMACGLIASAQARRDGVLLHEGMPLTSERVRAAVDHWLLDRDFINPHGHHRGWTGGVRLPLLWIWGIAHQRTGHRGYFSPLPPNALQWRLHPHGGSRGHPR